MAYSIAETSKMFNLPASTLRYYEQIGLLEDVEYLNSRRFYNESHIDRLRSIECFKKALLPLADIKAFFVYEKDMKNNSQTILEMMMTQEEKTKSAMEDLQTGLEHIQKKVHYYYLINEAIKNNTPLPNWDDM